MIPLILGAVAIASQIFGFGEARKAAKRQKEGIRENLIGSYSDLDAQAIQLQQQTSEKIGVRAKQGMLERGKLRAIFADSGVVGNTQMRIDRESFANQGEDISLEQSNLGKGITEIGRQKQVAYQNARAGAMGVSNPSVAGLIGGLATTVMNNKELSAGANKGYKYVSSRFALNRGRSSDAAFP